MPKDTLTAYETMYIVRPNLDDDAVDRCVQAVEDFIKGTGATIEHTDKKGRRRLAYEVKKMRDGFYVHTTFNAKTQSITAIKRMMSLNEDIIREIIVARDPLELRV